MFIYRRNKKTGQMERITVPDWEYCAPFRPMAPNGNGLNLAMSSHASFAVITGSGSGHYSWISNTLTPSFWLLQTSTDSGQNWTTYATVSGSIFTFNATASFASGTSASIIGGSGSIYTTGRSNIVNGAL
jgi:hypothetical protein